MSMVSSALVISVALTGRIGSGKSSVAEAFRALAVPVLDLDAVGRALQRESEVFQKIEAALGEGALRTRENLAAICFADSDKMQKLEAIMHPLIWQQACLWSQQQQAPYGIVEASALRSKHASIHYIITVSASESIRQQRVISRGKQDAETFARINQLQQPPHGDFIIDNSGDKQQLYDQVNALHASLLRILANQP